MAEEYSLLEKTIRYLCKERKIHISLYDITNISVHIKDLVLPSAHRSKQFDFCFLAKSTHRGHMLCKKAQRLAVARAKEEKDAYFGQCHLGLSTLRLPVFWYDTMVAVIFVSNIFRPEDLEKAIEGAKRAERLTGVSADALVEKIQSTTEQTESYDEWLTAAQIVRHVILSVLEEVHYKPDTERKNRRLWSAKKNDVINAILEACNRNYAEELSIEKFAKEYYLNPNYLARLFKKEVGQTFSAYLNNLRIHKAWHMLLATDDKIVDIAYAVGYTSDAYFIRVFKKIRGVTPLQFRQQSRKSQSK
ncbi:MAG: helix-turn-helix domain-containing protein [Clostridia bacterium]|nr:helix-turn-helix domain-containing protein [Oscillospiraceae bacterium]MBQ7033075.1 helix-turn-helix domain-containing protein [Clostridia bacterium]